MAQVAKTAFREEMDHLATQYPKYAESIQNTYLWYDRGRRIRLGDAACHWQRESTPSVLDLAGCPIELSRSFFKADEAFHDHMIARAVEKLGSTNVDSGHRELANKEFDKLPIKWPEGFRFREVNNVVRIRSWDHDDPASALSLQKATYLDQLATNISADVPIVAKGGQTFRALDRSEEGGLKPFSQCAQANSIGVAALFVDRNGVPIQRWREKARNPNDPSSERLAVMARGWHCGSSGALTWEDIVLGENPLADAATQQRYWLDGLVRGMAREIKNETGVGWSEGLWRIAPYHFARELKRAGKPQFFFLVQWHGMSTGEVQKEILGRFKAEPDEYHDESRKGIFGRLGPKEWGFRFPKRLRLDVLTHAALFEDANDIADGSSQTYESYASLFFAAGIDLAKVRWCTYAPWVGEA